MPMLADAHISSLGCLCSHLMRYPMNMFDHVHVRSCKSVLGDYEMVLKLKF